MSAALSPIQDGVVAIRRASILDAEACGRVAYAAHRDVSLRHGFPPEHASLDFSIGLMKNKISDPSAYGLVAERGATLVGSVFLNTFPSTPVIAIGPLTVNPGSGGSIGKELMHAALLQAQKEGFEQIRLVQSPAHLRSLVLYLKFGFAVREPLVLMQTSWAQSHDTSLRLASCADVSACNDLCVQVHGFRREFELISGIREQVATVVERNGDIVAYTSGIGLRGHAVARTEEDLLKLINASPHLAGPGFFVPARQSWLIKSLLEQGAHALWPATLMTLGPYQEPDGAFLPSIAF